MYFVDNGHTGSLFGIIRPTKSSSSPCDSLSGPQPNPDIRTTPDDRAIRHGVPQPHVRPGASNSSRHCVPALRHYIVRVHENTQCYSPGYVDLSLDDRKQPVDAARLPDLEFRNGMLPTKALAETSHDLLVTRTFHEEQTGWRLRPIGVVHVSISLRFHGARRERSFFSGYSTTCTRPSSLSSRTKTPSTSSNSVAACANPRTQSHPCVVAMTCTLLFCAARKIIRQKS